jgi:hypothetical protein
MAPVSAQQKLNCYEFYAPLHLKELVIITHNPLSVTSIPKNHPMINSPATQASPQACTHDIDLIQL